MLDRLRSLGGHVIDLSGADAAASAANARDAVAAGAERLVVLGGDGMVHLAVQAVAGTDTILGVVPVGTGNDFVRHSQVSLRIRSRPQLSRSVTRTRSMRFVSAIAGWRRSPPPASAQM